MTGTAFAILAMFFRLKILLAFCYGSQLIEILINQVDQPDLGLPLSMYLDLDSYADYIAAYKTYMVDTARVMVRELGTAVPDEQLATVRNCFVLKVSPCLIISIQTAIDCRSIL